jgi:hypothetical protein
VIENEPTKPRQINKSIDLDLETICLKCLEKDPQRRYESAEIFAKDLERWQQGEPIEARPSSTLDRIGKWMRRKPAIAGLASLTVMLLLAMAIGSPIALFRISKARNAAQREGERADQNVYDSDMSLAQHAWDEGDVGRTRELLEAHGKNVEQKDRRGFEWFYFWNLCQGSNG